MPAIGTIERHKAKWALLSHAERESFQWAGVWALVAVEPKAVGTSIMLWNALIVCWCLATSFVDTYTTMTVGTSLQFLAIPG